MKASHVLGIFLIVLGVCVGLYFGLWWAFIGGIVGIINQIKAEDVDALIVAVNVAKVLGAGFIGTGSAMLIVIPGATLLSD